MAQQMIDSALHRDLQMQQLRYQQAKDQVAEEGTIFAQMRQIYADDQTAMAASWAASKELVAARADEYLQTLKPAERTLQAQQFIAQNRAEAQEAFGKVNEKAFEVQFKNRQLALQQQALELKAMLGQKLAAPDILSRLGVPKGKEHDRANSLIAAWSPDGEFGGGYKDLKAAVRQFVASPNAESASNIESITNSITQRNRQLFGMSSRFNEHINEIETGMVTGLKTPLSLMSIATRPEVWALLAQGGGQELVRVIEQAEARLYNAHNAEVQQLSGGYGIADVNETTARRYEELHAQHHEGQPSNGR
jgi:hypothetical protein